MAQITAAMVKALRDETGQGMMECKKALTEADGDREAAHDILRKKGLALADKRAERETAEGLVGIKVSDDGTAAAMVVISCETDFCARNDLFGQMVASITEMALAADVGPVEASDEINNAVQGVLAQIGENMGYVRGIKIAAPTIGTYLHHNSKVGVLVGIDGEIDPEALSGICMHIAFADPVGVTADDVPAEIVEKERAFATQQAIDSGKPPEIAEKMVEGKMRKFMAGKALLEQPYVREEKKKVKDILGSATVTTFARFAVGG